MSVELSDDDLNHLRTFPLKKKVALRQKITIQPPKQKIRGTGNTCYDKILGRLRNNRFSLIDFQPMDTACTTTWYRRAPTLLRVSQSETVAIFIWQSGERNVGNTTTLSLWQLSKQPLQW